MAMNHRSEDELERRAALQREEVTRDIASVRRDLRREMDVRGRLEDRIRARPQPAYLSAAGAAAFLGFILARILKG